MPVSGVEKSSVDDFLDLHSTILTLPSQHHQQQPQRYRNPRQRATPTAASTVRPHHYRRSPYCTRSTTTVVRDASKRTRRGRRALASHGRRSAYQYIHIVVLSFLSLPLRSFPIRTPIGQLQWEAFPFQPTPWSFFLYPLNSPVIPRLRLPASLSAFPPPRV